MKVKNIAWGFVFAAFGALSLLSVPVPSMAAPGGYSESCSATPPGGGWVECTVTRCNSDNVCVVVETYWRWVGEAVVHK